MVGRRGEESQKMGILGRWRTAPISFPELLSQSPGAVSLASSAQEFLCTPIFLNTTGEVLWTGLC